MLEIAVSNLAGDGQEPALLVLGPSLGTAVAEVWAPTLAHLAGSGALTGRAQVIGFDLPGHGASPTLPTGGDGFTVDELVQRVGDQVEQLAAGRPVLVAGVSFGGAVALCLAAAGKVAAAAVIASAPVFGAPQGWRDRAAQVRSLGTVSLLEGTRGRWFTPDFAAAEPALVQRLLDHLAGVDDESYAQCCEALVSYDVTDRLAAIRCPLQVLAGAQDPAIDASTAAAHTATVTGATFELLPDTAHLPPAQAPERVAEVLTRLVSIAANR